MSKYKLRQLIRRWAQEEITVEQVLGQILLHLQDLQNRVEVVETQARSRKRTNHVDEG